MIDNVACYVALSIWCGLIALAMSNNMLTPVGIVFAILTPLILQSIYTRLD